MNEQLPPAVQLAPNAVTVRSDDPDPWTAAAAYAEEQQRTNPPAWPPLVYAVVDGVPVPLGTAESGVSVEPTGPPAPAPRRIVPAKGYSGRFGCPVPRNAKCPCGSGRKFKACCRPKVTA